MIRGGATATTDNVEETALGPLCNLDRHVLRPQIIATQLVGQPGIGMGRNTDL